VTSLVLAAVVANRWFDRHRGLVLGALTAANATGQLLFLPLLARLSDRSGWRSVALLVSAFAAFVFVVVFALMRDHPSEMNLDPYGRDAEANGLPDQTPAMSLPPLQALREASRPLLSGCWPAASSFAAPAPTD
jgi:predicted MFS family arabinose efflux permease